jgi:selT/selW/selH-like putative selenoprotein
MLLNILFFGALGLALLASFGDRVAGLQGVGALRWAAENRMMALGLLFMGYNMARSSLASTGAFEVYFQGKLVFSKLATGRMPELTDLATILG